MTTRFPLLLTMLWCQKLQLAACLTALAKIESSSTSYWLLTFGYEVTEAAVQRAVTLPCILNLTLSLMLSDSRPCPVPCPVCRASDRSCSGCARWLLSGKDRDRSDYSFYQVYRK